MFSAVSSPSSWEGQKKQKHDPDRDRAVHDFVDFDGEVDDGWVTEDFWDSEDDAKDTDIASSDDDIDYEHEMKRQEEKLRRKIEKLRLRHSSHPSGVADDSKSPGSSRSRSSNSFGGSSRSRSSNSSGVTELGNGEDDEGDGEKGKKPEVSREPSIKEVCERHPRLKELYYNYLKQVEESWGFDVDVQAMPRWIRRSLVHPIQKDHKAFARIVGRCGKRAVKAWNRVLDEDLVFHKIVKANLYGALPSEYYLTVDAVLGSDNSVHVEILAKYHVWPGDKLNAELQYIVPKPCEGQSMSTVFNKTNERIERTGGQKIIILSE